MKIFLKSILLLIFYFPIVSKSQQTTQPDSLLNKMIGQWVLKGTIAGQETTHDIDVKRVLGGQYIQIKETSREKDEEGNPQYDALVYICWQEPKKEYFCLWLDNTSNEGITNGVTGHAQPNGDKIEFLFEFSKEIKFHTTFLYDGDADTWQWLMNEDEKGTLKPFAQVSLTRNK